jgi:hypothetical protein
MPSFCPFAIKDRPTDADPDNQEKDSPERRHGMAWNAWADLRAIKRRELPSAMVR